MNRITREELKLIDYYKQLYKNDYQQFVSNVREKNSKVDEYLQEHEGKKHEVKRTSPREDRKVAKGKFKNDLRDIQMETRPSRIRQRNQQKYSERREESKGEHLNEGIHIWTAGAFSAIRANEKHVNDLDPRITDYSREDYEINHKELLRKIALFAAAKEENANRPFFSKLFNWKKDFQNWWQTRKIRKSIEQDNGMTKKEFKNVYKFISDTNPNKYDHLVTLNEKGERLEVQDEVFENNDNFLEKQFEVEPGLEKQTENEKIVSERKEQEQIETEQEESVEQESMEIY